MRTSLLLLCVILSLSASARDTTARAPYNYDGAAFRKGVTIATLAVGFGNDYRSSYTVPTGFEKGKTSGFAPVLARVEYAVSNKVSLAFNAALGSIYFNSFRLDSGYNGVIRRSATNKLRLLSGGIAAYYHLGHLFRVDRLDPYIGAGISLNNLFYTAFPEGDSTVEKKSHTATPLLKAGVRYYFSDKVSICAEAGYDRVGMISAGFSCRIPGRKKA